MSSSTTRKFLKLAVLPGIFPRLREMGRSGFGHIAFLLASLYNSINLLPNGHPYLNASNIGRFGIVNVISDASSRLVWKRENSDKIIMFLVTLIGMVLLFMQFIVLALAVVMTPALAMAASTGAFESIFTTPNPETDLAFIGMDMVFGVPDIFNSCIQTGAACSSDPSDQILQGTGTFPWPFHIALHSLFQIYSLGILVVAAMIIIYFAVAVVAETAQSGTPFGKRFNHVWAPLRLIVAIGLLVPLSTGLNSGQYITLYAAKIGSSMATNAWLNFNDDIAASASAGADGTQNTIMGSQTKLIGLPNPPKVQGFLQFIHIAKACQIAERHVGHREVTCPDPSGGGAASGVCVEEVDNIGIKLWAVRSNKGEAPSDAGCSFAENDVAVELSDFTTGQCLWHYFGTSDAVIRVGEQNPELHPNELGNVSKTCGEFVIPMVNPTQPGADYLSDRYIAIVNSLWDGDSIIQLDTKTKENFVFRNLDIIGANYDPDLPAPASGLKLEWVTALTVNVKEHIEGAYDAAINNIDIAFNETLREKGWAGAAIWYNKIAEINGLFTDTVTNFPYAVAYPEVMEIVAEERKKKNANASGDKYSSQVDGEEIEFPSDSQSHKEKYKFYYEHVYQWWQTDPITGAGAYGTDELVGDSSATGNVIIDVINKIFGTAGLFDMRENADVHPLAQLSNLGKGIMNSTITQIIGGLGGIGAQFAFGAAGREIPAQLAGAFSNFVFSIASIGLTAGFLLYYVLPFLPFIYFFFAVIGWIKGIFEAMVGIPLWALAHIRIDGNGLPGDAAVNGYFLILEIIIRPILILFGLLASITIFAAAVQILNDIFDLVVTNLSGFNEAHSEADPGLTDIQFYRDPVDQFFYTIIYAVIVYLLATSSFKMIDTIPNQILRWAGQSVSSFNDQRQDAASGLTQYAAIGGVQVFGQAVGGLQQGGQALGGAGRALGGSGALNTGK